MKKKEKQIPNWVLILGFLTLATMLGMMIDEAPPVGVDISPPVSNDADDLEFDKMDAYYYGCEFVKTKLKSPATAEFPNFTEIKVVHDGIKEFGFKGYVDSQNSYGGVMRLNFAVVLEKDKGEWYLLEFIEL